MLSVVSMSNQPLPVDTPTSPVIVTQSYSHQSVDQPPQEVPATAPTCIAEQVETKEALLEGPPGGCALRRRCGLDRWVKELL